VGVIAGPAGIASSSPQDCTGEAKVRLVNTIVSNHERGTQLRSANDQNISNHLSSVSSSDISHSRTSRDSELCSVRPAQFDDDCVRVNVNDGNTKSSMIPSNDNSHPTRSWLGQSSVEKMSSQEKSLVLMPLRLRVKSKEHLKRRVRRQYCYDANKL
jgi:hypothetical protein